MKKRETLKDRPLKEIKEQFHQKDGVLSAFGEQVSAVSFYEDVFGDLELTVPVVFLDEEEGKTIRSMKIYEAIDASKGKSNVLMTGTTFFNEWMSKKSAKDIHAFIVDLDNVYSGTLQNMFNDGWRGIKNEPYAMPTYIVNSGCGLHLYYVFEKPVSAYHSALHSIDLIYRALAKQQSKRIYVIEQVQWFGQDFRMAGGLNKYKLENTVYRVGKKWTIEKLGEAVGEKFVPFQRFKTLETPTVKKKPSKERKGFKTSPKFYEYTLEHIKQETYEYFRYTSMCALTVIGWKCGIPRDTIHDDLVGLVRFYNVEADRKVKMKEIDKALKMYNPKAMRTPRSVLESWLGWKFNPPKRNKRKQADHLKRARSVQSVDYPNGEWRGNASKQELVQDYIKNHPNESVTEVARALNVDRKTVYKYR